jgi:His-Xaa-Ser system radical SAM maturase HxsC
MLPLYGIASQVRGFEHTSDRRVIRLRNSTNSPSHAADAAIVRDQSNLGDAIASGFSKAVLVGDETQDVYCQPNALSEVVVVSRRFDYFGDGDLIGLHPSTLRFRTLYRRSSVHNSFLVTERCNNYCLMCSQPPRDIEDGWIFDEIAQALPLIHPDTKAFTLTGGEPLLEWRRLIGLLNLSLELLPTTAVHVLTNGRAFADTAVVAAWADVRHPRLMAGIPIYSAVDSVHDYVVQAHGAFDETVLGVLKLKDKGQRVEIRVVLHAVTAPRIVETATWLARNLPFVDHVALMGLEHTGFTLANEQVLWIDPVDYQKDLARAVDILVSTGIRVSVYNLPRCVLAKSTWPYAVQSISDWKNAYVEACESCIERPRCSGFFTTGRPRYSRGISPILANA